MVISLLKFCLDNRALQKRTAVCSAVISLILFAISSTAIAGPSAEDMDYNVVRPLKMVTKVSNNIRFDIITPKDAIARVAGGEEASWYSDELVIVRQLDNGKILIFARAKIGECRIPRHRPTF